MYTMLDKTRVNILEEIFDNITLTLYINPDLKMDNVYESFKTADLQTIVIYNDDGTLYGIRSEYINVGNFIFDNTLNRYIINLNKHRLADLKTRMDLYDEKLSVLTENVTYVTESNFTKQSEYALSLIAETFTDEQALKCILLFPEWDKNGVFYKKGKRLQYKNKLYKVLLDHTSQGDWMPDSTPSLYVEISDPSIEYPEWKNPLGSHDAYSKGDKITYKGKKYISKIDANIYSPEEYPDGWELVG